MEEPTTIVHLDSPIFRGSLSLKRVPKYLRFCWRGNSGCAKNWDALDQIEDTPESYETCVAAVLQSRGTMHVDRTVKGRRVGEWHGTATYEVFDPQPSQEIMHDNAKWREWCMEQEQKVSV